MEIGALGFLDNRVVTIVSFFDERDLDRDGNVSWKERLFSYVPLFGRNEGEMIVRIALEGGRSGDVYQRDPTFRSQASWIFQEFAGGLIRESIYLAYFDRPVRLVSTAASKRIFKGKIKQILVRTGSTTIVKQAFERVMN